MVELDRALYGCVQSAKVWYDELASFLFSSGFKKNDADHCVWNIFSDGVELTICFHVDDILQTCASSKVLDWFNKILQANFQGTTVKTGDHIEFLSVKYSRKDDKSFELSMPSLLHEIIKESEGVEENLGSEGVEIIDENSKILNEKERNSFHAIVAQSMYLARIVRPDIAFFVSVLSSRVTKATVYDMKKLLRLQRYLRQAREFKMVITPERTERIEHFVDASFCLHPDGKGHTGCAIFLTVH